MKLSKNFNLSEFTRSQTASNHGIKNEPSEIEIENLRRLCVNILQPLRDQVGKAIKINSGYRSEELNKKVGGSKTSSHKKGEASDIECDQDRENVNLFLYIIENLDFDQLIIYKSTTGQPRFVHVSYREGSNRNQAMIKRDGGGYELTDAEKIKKEF